MDYKELIEQLQRLSRTRYALIHTEVSYACADAATAIETLLAERDAAVNDLKNVADCTSCKFFKGEHTECCECDEFLDKWEWRGLTPPDRERTER